MLHSPSVRRLSKRLLTAASFTLLTTIPVIASAAIIPGNLNASSISQGDEPQQGLVARKNDKDEKKGQGDRDDDDREVRFDLNRAKNLARQAAEAANGGIQFYRAEDAMHGPAQRCPYVDNGDSWTFTFLGSRVVSRVKTIESVVTVYKSSRRIVVAYNGAIRSVQQAQVVSFTTTQRTVLVDLLRGTCSCNSLLSRSVRTQIISQSRSLPPGIQKQLLRGKGLPPGIVKKLIPLPKQVNSYIALPTAYDLVVIGSNVVLIDQVNDVVVDYISNVFL